MAGTVKIWWHDGGVRDVRYHDIPVVNEPELGFDTVAVGAVAENSNPAPINCSVAIVESDINVRYAVRPGGIGPAADATTSKPIAATGLGTEPIGVAPRDVISFIEV